MYTYRSERQFSGLPGKYVMQTVLIFASGDVAKI